MGNFIVSKFGGSALADSEMVKKTAEIIKSDPARKFIVVSAPGRRFKNDLRVTDLLYLTHSRFKGRENYDETLNQVKERFVEIINGLGINFDIEAEIAEVKRNMLSGKTTEEIACRGEYIMAKILSLYLDWQFVDSAELIYFKIDGELDLAKTLERSAMRLRNVERAIIPGFYGSIPGVGLKTFPRGGGDTSGALIARALKAELYEKWSETTEVYTVDPSIVPDPHKIRNVTYMELRELTYMGIKVIYEDVIALLQSEKIPISIRNIYNPADKGTRISEELPENSHRTVAACIAGQRHYKAVRIEKFGLNKMHGIGEKIFGIFARRSISCEHYISGIYNFCIILRNMVFDLNRAQIIDEIKSAIGAESITVENDISLIAIIGKGMGTVKGIFAKIFDAIAAADVKIRMISQGADDLNIVLGVRDADFEKTIKALYDAMILSEKEN